MVIRCERCSTMYELDESLLAPTGSQVQCTRCQHVFTAFPPRAAGRTLAGVPAAEPEREGRAEPPAGGEVRSQPPSPPPPAAREGAPARTARNASPAVYRPSSSSSPVGRAPVLKRDTVGTFEARLRWSARWRWLAPTLAACFLVAVAALWLLLSRRGGGEEVPRADGDALALIARDDGASLDQAAEKLEAAAAGRKPRPAAADRALALVLRAAGLTEEREAIAARLAARAEERERMRAAGAGPVEDASAAIAVLEREVRDRDERVHALSAAAAEQLRAAQAALGDTLEVRRAAASLHALRGERDPLQKLLRTQDRGRHDPWLDLADGWLDARDPDRAMRERALVKLGALAAARPDILRGRYLLARAEASLGRRAEALAAVNGVLAANARHDGARRLREELSAHQAPATAAPPPAAPAGAGASSPAPAPPPALPPAPRAEKAQAQRRKPVPQPAPGASPPAPGEPPAAAASSPAPEASDPPAAPAVPPPAPAERSAEPPPAPAPPPAPPPARPLVEPPDDPGSQGG